MSDAVYEGPDFHPEAPKNTRAAGQGAAASGFSGAPRCHAAGEGKKPAGASAEGPQNENGGSVRVSSMTTGEAEAWRAGWRAAREEAAKRLAREVYEWRIQDMAEVADSLSYAVADIRELDPPA